MNEPAIKLNRDDFAQIVKNTPLISIDLIVRNKEREVLLGLRNNEPARGFWFVPGGRILKDERMAQAFRRIGRDELGTELEISDGKFLGVFEHLYDENFHQETGFGTHFVVLAYEIINSGRFEDLPNGQHHRFRWMKVGDLLSDELVHDNTKGYFR